MGASHDAARPVWTFADSDYRFGSGPLRMTVDRVDWTKPMQRDGQTWYEVFGQEMSTDGRVVGPRWATVKASRLSELRRHG